MKILNCTSNDASAIKQTTFDVLGDPAISAVGERFLYFKIDANRRVASRNNSRENPRKV